MNIGFRNPYSSNYNNKVAFKSDLGVLQAIEALQKRVTTDRIADLQLELQNNMKFSNDFIRQILIYTEEWKLTLIKYAPDDVKTRLKGIFGMK